MKSAGDFFIAPGEQYKNTLPSREGDKMRQ
jgi:hypothetical protein